ncbi:hypothetical protein QTP70_010114 [Hemibagrus guttatus]|uniref:Uncharacterized protein n=1 Tax=Hemibagrus guttatus TaxID=175788 RepID=A0AAE0QA04_9TELE|nr:hypothetical protein QTP70_010114 [Hemibagrus guttatus]
MATEESNGAEFQEKTGLKRKLTGPPRLLLGKSRSPGQKERKSRKHRRHDEDADDTPTDTAKDEQSPEPHEPTSPEPPETLLTTEPDGGTCTDLQEGCLETKLEQNTKKSRRRSKAGATIRRIFSCVRKRKELGMKAVEDAEENMYHGGHINIQDEEHLTHSCDTLKMKKPVKKISSRKFKVRMWRLFKKRSSTSKQEGEERGEERCNDTFTEISSETGAGQQISAEPPAAENQQTESSRIVEDVTRICEENCLESPDSKNEVMEMSSLNVDVNVVSNAVFIHESESHHHPSESHISCLVDEEIQMSEASLTEVIESDSDPEDPSLSPEDPVGTDDMLVDAPVFKCKPIITIEDVHSSDEENDELFENVAPRHGTLSPLVTLNGSCYTLKTPERRFSEILLAQTALSLVRTAISGAIEQLSAELQSRQMDQDRV